MPGRTAGFATGGCAKDAHARQGVGKPEGWPVAAIPQHRLRVEVRQLVRGIGDGKSCRQGAEFGKANAQRGRCVRWARQPGSGALAGVLGAARP